AVRVATCAVAGEIHASKGFEIRVDEALMIAVDGTHLPRPAIEQYQIAFTRSLEQAALVVDDGGLHAEERHRGGARLQVDRARQRRDQYPAGFSLPPRVDDGTAAVADDVVIPLPGFRIDRFSHRPQQPQRLA